MILIFFSILAACVLIVVGFLQSHSPGKPAPFIEANGKTLPNSLSEKVRVDINGVEQGMFIKSKDVSHPVLLYLHGGMPDYFLTEKYPTGLEDLFIVCYWEQRGTGISYDPNAPRDAIHTGQMISDTLAVTNYLRQRFGKEKIYLMGHSGCSKSLKRCSRFFGRTCWQALTGWPTQTKIVHFTSIDAIESAMLSQKTVDGDA